MTNKDDRRQDDPLAEEYPELIAGLSSLRESIEKAKYPGQAWPVKRRGRGVIIKLVTAASAAAAAMLVLSISLHSPDQTKEARPVVQALPQEKPCQSTRQNTLPQLRTLPQTRVSSVSQIINQTSFSHYQKTAAASRLPALTVRISGKIRMTLPPISLPQGNKNERNIKNDQKPNPSSSSVGNDGGLLCHLHNRPDRRGV